MNKQPAFQDGPDFYHVREFSCSLIAAYPELVADDFDTNGAAKARERFLSEFERLIDVLPYLDRKGVHAK